MIALCYIPFCIWFGYINAQWIEYKVNWNLPKKKMIKHFFNWVIHVVAGGICYWITKDWIDIICVALTTRIVFTTALNYFHIPRQPIDYVTKTPRSWTDIVEQKIFGRDGMTPLILYTAVLIILVFV